MAVSIGPCSPSHVYSHPHAQLNLFSGRDFISHQTMLFQYHYVWSYWLEPLDHFMVHDYAVGPLEPKHSPDSLKWSLGRELCAVSRFFVQTLLENAADWCGGFTLVMDLHSLLWHFGCTAKGHSHLLTCNWKGKTPQVETGRNIYIPYKQLALKSSTSYFQTHFLKSDPIIFLRFPDKNESMKYSF